MTALEIHIGPRTAHTLSMILIGVLARTVMLTIRP